MLSKKTVKHSYASKKITQTVQLPDINEKFIEACENGDIKTVTYIIQNVKDYNIEVTDNLGRSALRIAVENEHLEIVQMLLGKSDSQKIRDALLLAIYLGHTSIAESILKHPKYKILNEKKFLDGDQDSFWQRPSSDDAQFSPDITPIMLAAQYNRTEIVQMLLLNGDRISKPHDFNCKCTECQNKFKFDSLRHAQSRLNAYKGLASESYISLASIDPILTAFQLSRELGILAEKEKYFKHEYLLLRNALSTYSMKLLNNVRGRDELDIVLNKTGKEKEEKYEKLARLDLAIRFKEKPFVAHSNCQQKLVEIWYSGVRKITKMNSIVIMLLLVVHILLIPITSIFYIIAPSSKVGKYLSLPSIKFVSHFVSYIAFICFIITSYLRFSEEDVESKSSLIKDHRFSDFKEIFINYTKRTDLNIHFDFSDIFVRQTQPVLIDIFISVWVVGHTVHELKLLFSVGIYEYIYSATNTFNLCMNVLYLASYGLKYSTMILVKHSLDRVETPQFWNKVQNLTSTDVNAQIDVYTDLYWLNSDRFYWQHLDPIYLSEGLFAIANVFTFTRLCFYLPANEQLGPLEITLGKMINDIFKFIAIFLIIFTAFVFGLNNLYWYYDTEVRKNVEICEHEEATHAEEAFGSFTRACMTLFFALYTIGDSKDTLLNPFDNDLTVGVGYFLFCLFHIANITIMINMLIAMMTKSYENIIHQTDVEWKFARSKLYMEYIKEGFTLPVPINLLPTSREIVGVFRFIKLKILRQTATEPSISVSHSAGGGGGGGGGNANGGFVAFDELGSNYELKSQISAYNNPNEQLPKILAETGHKNGGLHKGKNSMSLEEINKVVQECANDSQKLTYKIVMDRVVKRYLMYNQGDVDELKQNEFDDIKQELQLMRFEIRNDMKKSRDDTIRNMFIINNGIQFIAEELMEQSNSLRRSSCGSGLCGPDDDSLSLSGSQGKSNKFKEIVLKNRSILKSINLWSNMDMRRTMSEEKDNDYIPETPSNSLSTPPVNKMRDFSSIRSPPRIEGFSLERLAFDIDTVYEDDI